MSVTMGLLQNNSGTWESVKYIEFDIECTEKYEKKSLLILYRKI